MPKETHSSPRTPVRASSRRRILLAGILTATGGGLLLSLGNLSPENPTWSRLLLPSESFESGWRQAFGDFADPALIGAAERAISARQQHWEPPSTPFDDILHHSFEDGLAMVQTRSREDYATDRIVPVDNWLLALTEAELILLLRPRA